MSGSAKTGGWMGTRLRHEGMQAHAARLRCALLAGMWLVAAAFVAETSAHAQGGGAGQGGTIRGKVELLPANPGSPVVVYVVGFDEQPEGEPPTIRQALRRFEPPVLPIVRGQKVRFENKDLIAHNVFSMSDARAFDLGEGKRGQSGEVQFDKTGIVDIYCNIHPEMAGTILVLPNRRFAATDQNGEYAIQGIPPGKWKVFAWHRLASPQQRTAVVAAGRTTELPWEIKLDKELSSHLNKHGEAYKTKPGIKDSY